MPITIPDGYGMASLVMRLSGRPNPYVVTYGFDHTGLPAGTPDAMATTIATAWNATGRPLVATNVSNSYFFERVHVLITQGGAKKEGNFAVNLQGSKATVIAPPPQVAVIVRKRTALAGRQFRGRMYFPPMFITEANLDAAGVWSGADLTIQQPFFNATFGALVTANMPMVLLHSPPKPPLTLPTPTLVTSLEIEATSATQRRRLR